MKNHKTSQQSKKQSKQLLVITAFVSFDDEKLEGSLTRLPERDELTAEVDEALVVEFYNQNYKIFTRSCDRNLVTASFYKLLKITSSERSQNFTEIRQAIFELSFSSLLKQTTSDMTSF